MTTPNLELPEFGTAGTPSGAQITAGNQALDAIVQLSVIDKDLDLPPFTPVQGDRYIVGGSPTGAWIGHALHVAYYGPNGWAFRAPRNGWFAWVEDEEKLYRFDEAGVAWVEFAQGSDPGPEPEPAVDFELLYQIKEVRTQANGSPQVLGTAAIAISGGTSIPAIATTPEVNRFTIYPVISGASTGVASSLRQDRAADGVLRSTGFILRILFSWTKTKATMRAFAGLTNNTAQHTATVEPSSLTNIMGVGADSGDTNLQWLHNDGASTATKVDMGVSLTSLEDKPLRLEIRCDRGGSTVSMRLEDLGAQVAYTLSPSLDIPADTTNLLWQIFAGTGPTNTTTVEVALLHAITRVPFLTVP